MTHPHPPHIRRLLPPLHLKHTTQIHILAQRLEHLVCIDRPDEGEEEEESHEGGEDESLFEEEETGHEDLEDEDAPDEPGEGYGPCLALGFVWFVEDYSRERGED